MDLNNKNLYHIIKDGKSGFIDSKGKIIIDCVFDGASTFSEGLARIFVNGKVGFIDTGGNVVIAPQFENAFGFSNGYAVATVDGAKGYINTSGEFTINPTYYNATDFNNEIALIQPDIISQSFFINKSGEIILNKFNYLISEYKEGLINCSNNDGWGFIDLNENFIIPPIYSYSLPFNEGLAPVILKKSKKNQKKDFFGFINKSNEIVIEPIFNGVDVKFSEELCAVYDSGFGYINKNGELVIPYEFDIGEHFKDGLALVKEKGKNKKYGFINKKGNLQIPPIYNHADSFENGLASVIIGKEPSQFKYGFIDKKGNYIWEPTR